MHMFDIYAILSFHNRHMNMLPACEFTFHYVPLIALWTVNL